MSERQLEPRRQLQPAGHLAHFLVARPVGLVARVVEGGGEQILKHLLFGRDHQAVVDGDRLDPAFRRGADADQAAARDAFDLDRVELCLRLLHLGLDGGGGFLRRLHHVFDRFHGFALCRLSPGRSSSASGKAAKTAFTTGSSRIRASLRSEEHTSELQSLMRISYAVFCLKKKKIQNLNSTTEHYIK